MNKQHLRYLKSIQKPLKEKRTLKKKNKLQTLLELLSSPPVWKKNLDKKTLLKVPAQNLYSRARMLGKTI